MSYQKCPAAENVSQVAEVAKLWSPLAKDNEFSLSDQSGTVEVKHHQKLSRMSQSTADEQNTTEAENIKQYIECMKLISETISQATSEMKEKKIKSRKEIRTDEVKKSESKTSEHIQSSIDEMKTLSRIIERSNNVHIESEVDINIGNVSFV